MPERHADGAGPGGGPQEIEGLVPAILHIDMDSFFASVEVLDNPALTGKPVIVGGDGRRGVVASCTYEARAYGIRSAMPSLRARQLCPHAVFVGGRYSRYAEMSHQLRRLLIEVTPLVEPIGLDEAFLDVTGARRLQGTADVIARRLREAVRDELRLGCSVGVGRSKLVAKLASRAAKPSASRLGPLPGRGVVVITPGEEAGFLGPLPVESLWGVGPATARRLHELGVRTVGDLAELPEAALVRALGRAQGSHLAALARGRDTDPVVPDRPPKSVGHEETFASDLVDRVVLNGHLLRMAQSVAVHLRTSGLAGRTVTVKVKFPDFSLATRSHTLPLAVDTDNALAPVAHALLDGVDVGPGVRLLGLSVSGLEPAGGERQLRFALDGSSGDAGTAVSEEAARRQSTWEGAAAAIDAVRARYGAASVGTAGMVAEGGITVPGRRQAPWGPADPGVRPDGQGSRDGGAVAGER